MGKQKKSKSKAKANAKNRKERKEREKIAEHLRLNRPCRTCGQPLTETKTTLYHGPTDCAVNLRANKAGTKHKAK